tara:strand:- start:67 stop:7074 length:7008 start_codon:yes stop_codon:yes gene_type:complete
MTTKYTKYDDNPDLQSSILTEDPFLYAHLVKFERVPDTASGLIAEEPKDYSYITDASFNINFNDGSKSVAGVANGSQTYIAGRLLSVGNIADTTEAKVSNVSLKLSSISLGSSFTATSVSASVDNRITITDQSASGCKIVLADPTATESWLGLGFTEGDRIKIASSDGNNGLSVTISKFENSNYTAVCVLPSKTPIATTTNTTYVISYETGEVSSVLDDPTDATYNNYINREVSIYKAHIDPSTGDVIGSPYLLFKGIISKAKITDDPNKNSIVTWTLTSHWGDFIRVNGRKTVDSEHRALGANARPDLAALYRDDYAFDYGFAHGDQAVNIIAIYQVQETRYKMKKSGLFGLKTKMKEYQVTVDRDVDLRLNLEAKYLPVIYGVQRTDSIPVFADSLANDSKKIYVAYAICEGEISGLYDIYVDDQSRICIDKNDSDTRATQTGDETIDVICEGRMDKGDTLSSAASVRAERARGMARGPSSYDYYGGGMYGGIANWLNYNYRQQNLTATTAGVNGATGITHRKQTSLKYPISSRLVFHAGRSHQQADDTLVRIAKAGKASAIAGFKLQADLSANEAERADYWTQNHRLLDTAYVVAEYTIAEGDVTIPELDFVVRGKEIEQYNYDYSYKQHPNPTFSSGTITDKRALFKVGNFVDFYRLDNTGANNGRLATGVQIVDATDYESARAETIHKFRFSEDPLQATDVREFYMVAKDAAYNTDSRYPMITWNYKSHSGTVPSNLYQTVTETVGDGNATVANTSTGGGTGVDFTELAANIQAALASIGTGLSVGIILDGQAIADRIAEFLKVSANPVTSGGTTTDTDQGETQVAKDKISTYALLNAIQLASSASSTNDFYNGQYITLIQTDNEAVQNRQTREIVDYDGTNKIAYLGSLVDVAANASAVTGTFVTLAFGYETTSILLNNVTNLAIGQVISAANESTATIEDGTKIIAINTSTKTITVDKPVSVNMNAVINSHASGGADTKEIEASDWDVLPSTGDKYEIYGEGDKKVSINPAVQLLDYITDGRYGRGLQIYTQGSDTAEKDIDLESFKAAARQCDTRSDVTLILPNDTYANETAWEVALINGQKWEYITTVSGTGYQQWEGTIKSLSGSADNRTDSAGTGYVEVTFTNCIGKIAHRWLDWKSYDVGNAVYHKIGSGAAARNKVYLVSAAGTLATPTTGNMASLSIQRTTDASITTAVHGVSSAGATEQESGEQINPVVKSWTGGSYEKSGYSIYDSDDVKYWRYLGWQSQDQREVTRHQTNALIRTDTPVFNNVNSMLEHFNGILRYVGGKYQLDVESSTPTIADKTITTSSSYTGTQPASNSKDYTDPRIIIDEDIIGAITVDDAGLKGSANTVSVSISDPNIRYDTRSVSFFKGDYLKEDRNIPKKKDVKTPLITNYFNARINAEQYLDQSRFNRKINFVIGSKGLLLLSGTIIKISYARFGWINKEYRISNLTYRPDCSVQVTAYEHNDASYIVTPKEKDIGARGPAVGPGDETAAPFAPISLTATGGPNNIKLEWTNTVGFSGGASTGWATQIWVNNNATFTNKTANTDFENGAVLLHTTTNEESYVHKLPDITDATTFYYWVRHAKEVSKVKNTKIKKVQKFSVYEPTSSSNGVSATASAVAGSSGILYLYKSSVNEPTDDPSDDSLFPTVTVTMSGTNAGKITGVASGQSSAALTSTQIIDTAGNGTGWYTEPQNPTDEEHVIWVIAATGNSSGSTDEIARGEWTEPVKFSGGSALNTAIVELYQRTNSASAPNEPSGTLTYTFASGALEAGSDRNNWTTVPSSPVANNQYLWKITAAAINKKATHDIPTGVSGDWSTPVLSAQFVTGGVGSNAKAVKLTANKYAIPFTEAGTESTTLTFTATPQGISGTATYQFLVDSGSGFVQKQAAGSSTTYQMAQNDEPTSADAHVVKVIMFDDGTQVADDSVSIYGVQDGSDALTVVFTNEAHVLPASKTGVVSSHAGSGTDIRIFKGATLLTAATSGTALNTFTVSASGSSITPSSTTGAVANVLSGTPTNETIQYSAHSGMSNSSDTASITYTISAHTAAGTTTITKVQSFSKSKKGEDGVTPGAPADGADGDAAARVITGLVYWQGAKTGVTASSLNSSEKPTSTNYNFNTTLSDSAFNSAIGGGGTPGSTHETNRNNWTITPPPAESTRQTVFYLPFTAVETLTGDPKTQTGSGPVTFGTVTEGINFTGVVTFSGSTITDGSGNTLDITAIDGSKITTGTVESHGLTLLSGQTNKDGGAFTSDGMYITLTGGTNNVHAGSIGSKHFRLKGETGEVELGSTVTGSGGGAISLNSSTQKITITDGSTPRVIIGKLS